MTQSLVISPWVLLTLQNLKHGATSAGFNFMLEGIVGDQSMITRWPLLLLIGSEPSAKRNSYRNNTSASA
jgi:hypothetical protein